MARIHPCNSRTASSRSNQELYVEVRLDTQKKAAGHTSIDHRGFLERVNISLEIAGGANEPKSTEAIFSDVFVISISLYIDIRT
jgi:hypothetical protein